jgi:large subunit ribosomal protein L25
MATLNARGRTEQGKGGARRLRRDGLIPAVVYGRGETPRSLSVSAHELQRLLSSVSVENTIIDLQVEGQPPAQALIREVQYHPARPEVLHVDFFHVHAGETVHVEVPLRLHGSPVGVRDFAGVLDQILYSLQVECLPGDIPESLDIDVESMGPGESLHVRDVDAKGIAILNDPDLVICSVTQPTPAALPEAAETEEGVGGEVEPELVRGRREDAEGVPSEQGSRQPE